MYAIYRSEAAMRPLKQIWEHADEQLRAAILEASHRLDRQLARNPHQQGESRAGCTRILFQGPLGVLFEVDEDRKLVRILRTWTHGAFSSPRGGEV